ncbi:MAG: PDZ domain-containing protein [Parvularculaceae bacterium]|nr:PDZ domain-containing protein [Parvularculaceae bacterium]
MNRALTLVCIILAATGCGTVVRGTKQGVKFQSEPPGAAVTVIRAQKEKTRWTCVSPCELQLSRKRDFNVTFELDGYKPATARLASRIGAKGGATAIPGNFVAGGGIGFIVDAGTGANMQLKPDPMRAKLARMDSDEFSVVYDVRIEGGGKQDVFISAAAPVPAADGATGLKRLPRGFGAEIAALSKERAASLRVPEGTGVLVTSVTTETAAARAGLKPGDVIKSVNGAPIRLTTDIDSALSN